MGEGASSPRDPCRHAPSVQHGVRYTIFPAFWVCGLLYSRSVEFSAPTRGVDCVAIAWIFPRLSLLAHSTICTNMWRCTRPDGLPSEKVRSVITENYCTVSYSVSATESADHRESGAMPLFTQPEKSLLKFFDLNHMLEIKHEILSVSPASEYEGTISECLELATKVAEQAEMMSQGGYLLYLQDAGSAALSTFGIILHRVSTTQVTNIVYVYSNVVLMTH